MTKDEALDLALEALELHGKQYPHMVKGYCLDAITAIKQALAAPVQEPVAIPEYIRDAAKHLHENRFEPSFMVRAIVGWINGSPHAAKQPWVGLTDEEFEEIELGCRSTSSGKIMAMQKVEAKLKEKNAAAQPAVPDALTSADIQEHIEYVAGWNDCRQAMMEMMK
jgi:hypothetical protein